MARLVFPMPPGPVSVISRAVPASSVDRGQLRVPSEEARQPIGQIARHASGGTRRGEVRRQALDRQLEQPLRRGHVAKAVRAEVVEPGAARQLVGR